jgi:hypothetical protein
LRVRIAQCLCGPERHCLFGFGIHDDRIPDEDVLKMLHQALAAVLRGEGARFGMPPEMAKNFNPWCGICGAPAAKWKCEVGWSREFESLEHAQNDLGESQRRQRITKQLLDAAGVSYDAQKAREKARNN